MRALWKPLRRILLTLPVLWVVVSLVFLLIHLVPGDPIVQMLGEGATTADISALRDLRLVMQAGSVQPPKTAEALDATR